MADQVNPTGGLAPVPSLAPQTAARPQPVQDPPRATKLVDPQPKPLADGRTSVSGPALESAVKQVQGYLKQSQSDLRFQVDERSGQTYFKIVDSQTREVIRQVPSEDVLVMARKLRELTNPKGASGVLVDKEG